MGSKYLLFHSALLLFTVLCHGKDLFFNDNGKLQLSESYNTAWMAGVQDFCTLSLITIPGTHDSLALYGGPVAERQVWGLRDQLRAGIRFLDLKVFALWDTLYVMHGVMYERSTLREVLDTVREFLSEFRTEAVLIQVKPESFDKDSINQMVQSLISNDQRVWVSSGMPNMGQIRGKIVFVQKNTFTLGIPLMDTGSNGNNKVTNIQAQDSAIIQYLNQATEACGGDNMPLTFSSGTGFGTFWGIFLTPKRVAEKVDPWLNHYIRQFYPNHPRPCFGVIAMDFPGIDLIQTVANLNRW
ncbi:1-phosphatidylinositol phosphodiesterase-like [Lampris incognitus]|uniref:1-phosphatidylinositol phosphodiesterase-like n=1 Tax=Lampris incognitus TaxID=2546036 RepID=UPI0024B553B3|nr:1-phosphatidylinositol phosphodiesterase-like [Lampris incognitus]